MVCHSFCKRFTDMEDMEDNSFSNPAYFDDYETAQPPLAPPPPPPASTPLSSFTEYTAQQPHQMVTVNPDQQQRDSTPLIQSFLPHIMLACFTCWCCGFILGIVAFAAAVSAQEKSTSPDPEERSYARHLAVVSLVVSITGIVLGTGVYVVLILMYIHGRLL